MRKLTNREVELLEEQGCSAENWMNIEVDDEGFRVECVRQVNFYGNVSIGDMNGSVEVDEGFARRCCIRRATLRNVTIGDRCLIENVNGYISNYDIGNDVYISNVGILSSSADASFGNGNTVSVLNEGGDGNVFIYTGLTAQIASLMMMSNDVIAMAKQEVETNGRRDRGCVSDRSRIVGVGEMSNVLVGNACEVQGAHRLVETTILSTEDAPTLIGADVILENVIVAEGAMVVDGAKAYNSFIGESVHVGRGFTSESSLFFANSHMENGEACAAFCGPFSCSHHKSTLLIGGLFSFYNAGSATNQSNHAYKMGPIHYGTLQRGAKTASGCHILWPAQIGAFTMVMGKLANHPDLTKLPFSYVIASPEKTSVIPGINLRTVGTWRDVKKWPKRDHRPHSARRDLINFAFPNPYLIQYVLEGRKLLERLLNEDDSDELTYHGCSIRRSAALKGVQYYDLAIRLFVYEIMNTSSTGGNDAGADGWVDLAGMLAPRKEVDRILSDVTTRQIGSTDELTLVLSQVHADYLPNATDYYQNLLQQLGNTMFVDLDHWMSEAEQAHALWLRMVRDDAEHEFQLGDVEESALYDFLETIK